MKFEYSETKRIAFWKEIIQKELYGLIVNGEHLLYVGVD